MAAISNISPAVNTGNLLCFYGSLQLFFFLGYKLHCKGDIWLVLNLHIMYILHNWQGFKHTSVRYTFLCTDFYSCTQASTSAWKMNTLAAGSYVMVLAPLQNDKHLHLTISRLTVILVNSFFSHHEMLAFYVSKGFWWGGGVMQMICFSLVCLWTNSDSVKKEMHKWHSVESASVSAKRWQNVSFRSKILGNGFDSYASACQKAHFRRHREALLFFEGRVLLCCCCCLSPWPLDRNETFTSSTENTKRLLWR